MTGMDLKAAKILVVDDQADNLDILETVLDDVGYTNHRSVQDSLQVRAAYESWRPDLILLDLHMPVLDGFGVMEQLRPMVSAGEFLPILVITGDVSPAIRERALAEGARDFVRKPVDHVEVVQRITNLLEICYLQRALLDQNRLLETTVRERTAELRAQAADLRRTELKYRALVERIPAVIYLAAGDRVGHFLYVSPSVEVATGDGPRAWVDDPTLWGRRTHPEDRARVEEQYSRLRETGEPTTCEYRMTRRDGTVLWIRDEAHLVPPTEDGGAAMVQGVVLDITLRKAAELALKAEQRLLRAVLDSVDGGIVACGADGILTLFNRTAREWHEIDLRPVPPEDWVKTYDLFEADGITPMRAEDVPLMRALRGERVRDVEMVIAPASAPSRRITASGRPVVDDDGRNLGAVVSMTDVTDLRLAADEIRQEREARHHSEKLAALGTLLAGVAHELNNPLAVVHGQAQLLAAEAGLGPGAARAQKIAVAADRCARIVRNFLALARAQPTERAAMDVNRVVTEVVELVAYPLRVESIAVEVELDPQLPPLWADSHQMHQVLVNLLTNAHHALRDSPPPRRIRVTSQFDRDRATSVLEVADTGPGIPAAVRKRIFEPFFTTKPAGVGTGLGLALCRGIVEGHGGRLTVESAPGEGTTFRVELPASPLPAAPAAAPVPAPRSAARSGARILVVDDEPEVAEVLADVLCDHTVDIAADGVAALEMLASAQYDLILSDVRMPEMDGPALYDALKQTRPDLLRRIAFVTGDSISLDVQAFLERTRVPTLAKPFDFEAVATVVERMLEETEA